MRKPDNEKTEYGMVDYCSIFMTRLSAKGRKQEGRATASGGMWKGWK